MHLCVYTHTQQLLLIECYWVEVSIKEQLEIPILIISVLEDREYYPAFVNEETGISEVKYFVQGHTASVKLQMRCKPDSALHTLSLFWIYKQGTNIGVRHFIRDRRKLLLEIVY